MVLNRVLALTLLSLSVSGCMSGAEEARTVRNVNDRMERMDRIREELQDREQGGTARLQSPSGDRTDPAGLPLIPPEKVPQTPGTSPPAGNASSTQLTVEPAVALGRPTAAPLTRISTEDSVAPQPMSESQVRIVATIGNNPIYEREVRESIYMSRIAELQNLLPGERKAKEQEIFYEELKKLIERELILDEMFARLRGQKRQAQIDQLHEVAGKESENRLREIRKRTQIATDEDFKLFLQSQGLTYEGMRRNFERGTMMGIFMNELLKPKLKSIGLADIKDYYDSHGDEFMATDQVKWQDLYVRVDRFANRADARKYADQLLARAQRGEDFVKLVKEYDQGDSRLRDGIGFGEERGKIFPPELEPTVFSLKPTEVGIVELEAGYHLVRVAERVYAGRKSFLDEKIQLEIRKKLESQLSEREYRRLVETLWRRAQPVILVEPQK